MTQDPLQDWLHTPLGTVSQACERLLAGEILDELFGMSLVQLGHWGGTEGLARHCRVRHRLLVAPGPPADVQAELNALPLASGSVDVLLMPHTLETGPDPHGVLREAGRVVVSGGHILLLGFSRYSFWGLREALRRPPFRRRPDMQLLAERRVGDWMRLLGLELVRMERYFYRLPLDHGPLLRRSRWLENWGRSAWPGPWPACAYAALFRKQVAGMNPIRPRWRRAARQAGNPFPATD